MIHASIYRPPLWIGDIQTATATAFSVPVASMTKHDTNWPDRLEFSRARQSAMYLARALNPKDERFSYPSIGRAFNRDHTTVIHACRTIDVMRTQDPSLAGKLEEIEWSLLP